jgi:molecular chaperone GrpE (heat shock protein)
VPKYILLLRFFLKALALFRNFSIFCSRIAKEIIPMEETVEEKTEVLETSAEPSVEPNAEPSVEPSVEPSAEASSEPVAVEPAAQDDGLKQEILSLRELLESISFKLDQGQHKESLIDKLHAENQAYKNDLYKKFIMPIVNEIMFIMDNYAKLGKEYKKKDAAELDPKKLLSQFSDIVEDLENALSKNGIEAYESAEGSAVDLTKQKVAKAIPTSEQEKDKTVCESLKKGFILDEKILRQEQVTCYKYENTLSPKQEA